MGWQSTTAPSWGFLPQGRRVSRLFGERQGVGRRGVGPSSSSLSENGSPAECPWLGASTETCRAWRDRRREPECLLS